MNGRLQKWLSVGLVTLSILFLPGCWDYQKINNKALVYGIGIDPVKGQPEKLSYTFQIPLLGQSGDESGSSSVGATSGGESSASSYRNFTVEARGMSDALSQAQLQYSKMFFLNNLQAIVVNDKLTGVQVRSAISELMRSISVDKLAYVFFSPELASQIFEAKTTAAPADTISEFLAISLKSYGLTTRTHLWEFWRDLTGVGVEPQVPLVKTTGNGLEIYGLMGFRGTRPTIQLSADDTLYYNCVAESVSHMVIWVKDGQKWFEVGQLHSKRSLSASVKDGKPVLHARIRMRGMLMQDESDGRKELSNAEMEHYQAVAAGQIRQRSTEVFHELQAKKIDLYGFGRFIFIHKPSTEKFIKQKWPDMFAKAKPEFDIKLTLSQKGTLM